jgi:conjugal transfer mating pair stabilization protein TraG
MRKNIFNAIAMLMNGRQGGLIQPLMIIAMSIGTLWAVTKAFFSAANSFISQFILPLIAIIGLLMVTTSTVHIEDVLRDNSYKVNHVPFLLAKMAEIQSSIGYQITRAIEKTMHVPDDTSYNSTGMLFGADR